MKTILSAFVVSLFLVSSAWALDHSDPVSATKSMLTDTKNQVIQNATQPEQQNVQTQNDEPDATQQQIQQLKDDQKAINQQIQDNMKRGY